MGREPRMAEARRFYRLGVLGNEGVSVEGIRTVGQEKEVIVGGSVEEGDLCVSDLHLGEVERYCSFVTEDPYPDRKIGLSGNGGQTQWDRWLGARVGDLDRLNRLGRFAIEQPHRNKGELFFDIQIDQRLHRRRHFVLVVS